MRRAALWLIVVLVVVPLAFANLLMFYDMWRFSDLDGDWSDSAAHSSAPMHGATTLAPRIDDTPATEPESDETAPPGFTSTPDDEVAHAAPTRDGVVLRLIDAQRTPVPRSELVVRWRTGFGRYGTDRGRTDAAGRLATTIANVAQIESIEWTDAQRGVRLRSVRPPDPADAQGRELVVRLPGWREIDVTFVDTVGRSVPMVGFELTNVGRPREVGECVLGLAASGGTTDDDGVRRVALPEGIYLVEFASAGFTALADWWLVVEPNLIPTAAVFRVARERDGREVRVVVARPPGVTATPRVYATNDDDSGVRGAGDATFGVPRRRVWSGRPMADGAFVVDGVEPSPARVTVACDGCATATQLLPANVSEIVVTLVASAPIAESQRAVRGVVVDGAGKPVSGATVGLCRDERIAHATFVTSSADGSFTFPLLDDRPFVVTARSPRHAFVVVGPFDAARPPDLRIEMAPERELRGIVVDPDGRPAIDVDVWLFRERGPLAALSPTPVSTSTREFLADAVVNDLSSVDDDGRFAFDEIGLGRYELRAVPRAGSPHGIGRVVAFAGETVTITLGRGFDAMPPLIGRVVDAVTGAGVAGASVQTSPAKGSEASGDGTARTDAEGRFRCVGTSAGSVDVEVEASGYASFALRDIAIGAERPPIELRIVPATRLALRLVETDGSPVAQMEVGIDDGAGDLHSLQDSRGVYAGAIETTDPRGRVDLRGVPIGLVRLVVAKDLQDPESPRRAVEIDAPPESRAVRAVVLR